MSDTIFFCLSRYTLDVYDSLHNHQVASKSVVDRVVRYIKDEWSNKESSQEKSVGLADVLVQHVKVPRQFRESMDCGPLVVYYGIKLLLVSVTRVCFLIYFLFFS
jgi:Ulp1 family protease